MRLIRLFHIFTAVGFGAVTAFQGTTPPDFIATRQCSVERRLPRNPQGFRSRVSFSPFSSSSCTTACYSQSPQSSEGSLSTTSTTMLSDFPESVTNEDCPSGYYLDSVHNSCSPLGPLGRLSQKYELAGPFRRVHKAIANLFGIDHDQISSLGVGFALTYSILSNINGSITLAVSWYMTCQRTGLSPLAPGQWKALLASYGSLFALLQILKPFRVALAIARSKLSKEFLTQTEDYFGCSRGVAIALQYCLGWIVWMFLAALGISLASLMTGTPIFVPSS